MARPFDARRLEFTGEAVPAAERVRVLGNWSGCAPFSVSSTGLLVYAGGGAEDDLRLTWFDRSGKRLRVIGDPGQLGRLDLSPDGKTVAVAIFDRGNTDISTCDVLRGLCTRFTTDPALDDSPIWSSVGDMIVFRSIRNGVQVFSGCERTVPAPKHLLYADERSKWPNSLSPDGTLAYVTTGDPKIQATSGSCESRWARRARRKRLRSCGRSSRSSTCSSHRMESGSRMNPTNHPVDMKSMSGRRAVRVRSAGFRRPAAFCPAGGEMARNCSISGPTSD